GDRGNRTLMNAAEAQRRASRTDLVERLFRSRPGEWISAAELFHVGGMCAWRSYVSDARKRVKAAGDGDIDWNGDVHESAYRFVPFVRLGRDAATIVP